MNRQLIKKAQLIKKEEHAGSKLIELNQNDLDKVVGGSSYSVDTFKDAEWENEVNPISPTYPKKPGHIKP
ncbi:hypothetical protein [Aestuariibacter salexigens]|uniref:hypothetical protein n=1 Tax=Aestuariibacter salexigens TaxID=226010 RepID=UPI00041925F8|nr:hypothetical protein [Aestuariibacter salexigens]